jgi:hypothetical protein
MLRHEVVADHRTVVGRCFFARPILRQLRHVGDPPHREIASGGSPAFRNDGHPVGVVFASKGKGGHDMRILALAIAATFAIGIPMAAPAMAQDTTIINKHNDDNGQSKVIIKKKDDTGKY